MHSKDTKRLSRLTAILTQLQTKRLVTANDLAERFSVHVRTIYRDIRALEQAGVPVLTEEGRGYSLMDGYRIPPIMFTETEANALITAEQLVSTNSDTSLAKDYREAISKIKAVLQHSTKDKANLLADRVVVRQNQPGAATSDYLSVLQLALTNCTLTTIAYQTAGNGTPNQRTVEPFAVFSTQGNWILVAYCRWRKEFRSFRLDRINELKTLTEKFKPHTITLHDYFESCREKWVQNP